MTKNQHLSEVDAGILGLSASAIVLGALTSAFNPPLRITSTPEPDQWLNENWPALLIVTGLLIIVNRGRRIRGIRQGHGGTPPVRRNQIRVIRWWIVVVAFLAAGGATWAAASWMLTEANVAKDPASARIDAVRTSITVGGGVGATVALMLATRRQWLAEHAQNHAQDDATERRFTELYTKAVEQLGSDKASVRLGGFYALERLAQDNESHQQSIVEMICAYLRMTRVPMASEYEGPRSTPAAEDLNGPHNADYGSPTTEGHKATEEQAHELQVRLTAQRILTAHLRPDPDWEGGPTNPKYWPSINLDLAGATLVNLDMDYCQVHAAIFTHARFVGDVKFYGTFFDGQADFTFAEFIEKAIFSQAEFRWHANFDHAHFYSDADFEWVDFNGRANYCNSTFGGIATFNRARFSKQVKFECAEFRENACFDYAIFRRSADFDQRDSSS